MSIALYPASNHGVKYILKPKQTSYVLANQMGDAEISCCETQDAARIKSPPHQLVANSHNEPHSNLEPGTTAILQSNCHSGGREMKFNKVAIFYSTSNLEACFTI